MLTTPRAIAVALCCGLAALTLPAAFASRADAQRPGFIAHLAAEGIADPVRSECTHVDRRLTCVLYHVRPPRLGGCPAGASLPTMVLEPRGRARRTRRCVDEGSHDLPTLAVGRAWRSGPIRCTHRFAGEGIGRFGRLRCTNATRSGFSVDGRGRLRRFPGMGAARPAACGDIAVNGESGVVELPVWARGVDCETARTVLGDFAAGLAQGWECHAAGEEAECRRGNAVATYGRAPGFGAPSRRAARRCGRFGLAPRTDNVVFRIRARRTSCRRARRMARAVYHGKRRPFGFRCRGRLHQPDFGLLYTTWVCTKGKARVTWRKS
jgi:hypothetical protein